MNRIETRTRKVSTEEQYEVLVHECPDLKHSRDIEEGESIPIHRIEVAADGTGYTEVPISVYNPLGFRTRIPGIRFCPWCEERIAPDGQTAQGVERAFPQSGMELMERAAAVHSMKSCLSGFKSINEYSERPKHTTEAGLFHGFRVLLIRETGPRP